MLISVHRRVILREGLGAVYPGLRIPHPVAMTISLAYPNKCRDGAIYRGVGDPAAVNNDDAIESCCYSSSQYASNGFATDEFTGHPGKPKHDIQRA